MDQGLTELVSTAGLFSSDGCESAAMEDWKSSALFPGFSECSQALKHYLLCESMEELTDENKRDRKRKTVTEKSGMSRPGS